MQLKDERERRAKRWWNKMLRVYGDGGPTAARKVVDEMERKDKDLSDWAERFRQSIDRE